MDKQLPAIYNDPYISEYFKIIYKDYCFKKLVLTILRIKEYNRTITKSNYSRNYEKYNWRYKKDSR